MTIRLFQYRTEGGEEGFLLAVDIKDAAASMPKDTLSLTDVTGRFRLTMSAAKEVSGRQSEFQPRVMIQVQPGVSKKEFDEAIEKWVKEVSQW